MKRYNYIKTITTVLTTALLLAACSKQGIETPNLPQPPEGMGEVRLGRVNLTDDIQTGRLSGATRAAQNLAPGTTLRLYAFKTGDVNFGTMLATRTYTVDASGVPLLDGGQDPLYVPLGNIDIYMVGPVTHNLGTGVTDIVEIAASHGIYPHQGVDLIAGYTAATINIGINNPLPNITLTHKMARVQVVVSHHDLGVYENLTVKDVKLYNQPVKGDFAFDNTGGVVTANSNGKSDLTFSSVTEESAKQRYSITTLLIPQVEQEMKIETTFECNQKNIEASDNFPTVRYRQSGLVTSSLDAGSATQFTTAPLTPVEIKWRTKVLPWDDVDQGFIYVPGLVGMPPVTNGLVGLYDGKIPPQVINGELVWKDFSSQQNHARILEGTTWEATSNSYIGLLELIKEDASYLYSAQNGMTVELIWKRDTEWGDSSPFRIGKPGEPYTYLTSWKPAGTKYCAWDEDAAFRKQYTWGLSTKEEDVDNFACWAWTKGGHENTTAYYNQGYKNGIPQTTNASATVKPLAGKSYIGFGVATWRLQAVRIYNRQLTDEEIKLNHEFNKDYYGLRY